MPNPHTSKLIAVVFGDPYLAEAAKLRLLRLEDEDLGALEEGVVLMVARDGSLRFHYTQPFTLPLTIGGGFSGMLSVGLLAAVVILNPAIALIGQLKGAVLASIFEALQDAGIPKEFPRRLAAALSPGSSVLFVVARGGQREKVISSLKNLEGKLFVTPLAHEDESRLKAALENASESARKEAGPVRFHSLDAG
jgi:uncharacterized membrane protein